MDILLNFLFALTASVTPIQNSSIGTIGLNVEDLRWTDGPKSLPAGAKAAVLEGDPKQAGMFTMRIKLPANYRIQSHWHPKEERVTVISGFVWVGFGDRLDTTKGRLFKAGAFYINPPNSYHYVWTTEETVLQVTGTGPWELHYPDEEKALPSSR